MKLDADEQAIMDEIEISAPRPQQRVPRPTRPTPAPPQMHQQQESMDAFVNPNKQTAPVRSQPDEEIDYGEEEEDYFEEQGPTHQEEAPTKGYTSIDEEKADLINKTRASRKEGVRREQATERLLQRGGTSFVSEVHARIWSLRNCRRWDDR